MNYNFCNIVIAFLNYAPAILFRDNFADESSNENSATSNRYCKVWFHDNVIYLTITACVEFFVPLILIASLNLAVYLNIRNRTKNFILCKANELDRIHAMYKKNIVLRDNEIERLNESAITMLPSAFNLIKTSIFNLKKDKLAARSLFTLVVVFFVCWVNIL